MVIAERLLALVGDHQCGAEQVREPHVIPNAPDPAIFFGYLIWSLLYNGALVLIMTRLFEVRWRVAD